PLFCAKCHDSIGNEYVAIDELRWHLTHFTCEVCENSLASKGGYRQCRGKFYCPADFLATFAKKCAKCAQYIIDGEQIIHGENAWHPGCFVCAIC
ncbi:hypothetical protein GQ42DRAFT_135636, partial [Ramicandelaber brevisporus]